MILQNIFVNKCTGSLQNQLFQSFGKENNLLALPVLIASHYEFYMSILLSKGLGITGIKSKCIIKILKNQHVSPWIFIQILYEVYMQFICSFKTTCSLYAVLTKLHVVLETAYKLHINCISKIYRFWMILTCLESWKLEILNCCFKKTIDFQGCQVWKKKY